MRKFTKSFAASLFLGAVLLFSSCKDDSYLLDKPQTVIDNSFTEEFDNYSTAISNGWVPINRSMPIGSTVWKLGSPFFPAFSSNITNNGCFFSDYNCAGFLPTGATVAVMNNWLVSKPVYIKNGDKIEFYTRTSTQVAPDEYPDGLEVRVNPYNDLANVGRITTWNTAVDTDPIDNVGDFQLKLLHVNRNLILNGVLSYPRTWTKFVVVVDGMNKPGMSRFAFRHYTPNGGPNNDNGTDIAIDKVTFISSK